MIVFTPERERERRRYGTIVEERGRVARIRGGSCGWESDIRGLIKPRERWDRCDKGT